MDSSRVTCHAAQDQLGHLRTAVIAQRLLASQAAADVQHGRREMKHAAIETAAITAGHHDRADQGQANLATVNVAGQHQIYTLPAGPGDVVGRVAQAQAKRLARTRRKIGSRTDPGALVTEDHQRLAANLGLQPAIAHHLHAQFL